LFAPPPPPPPTTKTWTVTGTLKVMLVVVAVVNECTRLAPTVVMVPPDVAAYVPAVLKLGASPVTESTFEESNGHARVGRGSMGLIVKF
jgi:hypothetical protein